MKEIKQYNILMGEWKPIGNYMRCLSSATQPSVGKKKKETAEKTQ